jgi:hypothetical protein
VKLEVFRGSRQAWNETLDEATQFVHKIESEKLIGITHSIDQTEGVVAVWHWAEGAFWPCPHCGERIEDQFTSCWSCSTARNAADAPAPDPQTPETAPRSDATEWELAFRMIQGAWMEWDDFFDETAKLATAIGLERLVGISHSGGKSNALATVFYWRESEP